MGLDFTDIPDHHGPAVYVIGGSMTENRLKAWVDELNTATPKSTQVIYIDFKSHNGAKIAGFYGITQEKLPNIMIVMDDDSLYKNWSGLDLPSVQTVAHELSQVTGSRQA